MTYEESNAITTVKFKTLKKTEYRNLLACGESHTERTKAAQSLINYLCEKFSIPVIPIRVLDKPESHTMVNGRLKSKTMGLYRFSVLDKSKASSKITIYNLTAVKHQPRAIKALAETILHEFCHHYDYCVLHLDKSLHTAGFYKRIGDLQSKLAS